MAIFLTSSFAKAVEYELIICYSHVFVTQECTGGSYPLPRKKPFDRRLKPFGKSDCMSELRFESALSMEEIENGGIPDDDACTESKSRKTGDGASSAWACV